jgi:hypothetical protein
MELSRDLKIQKKAGGLHRIFKRIVGDMKGRIEVLNLEDEAELNKQSNVKSDDEID